MLEVAYVCVLLDFVFIRGVATHTYTTHRKASCPEALFSFLLFLLSILSPRRRPRTFSLCNNVVGDFYQACFCSPRHFIDFGRSCQEKARKILCHRKNLETFSGLVKMNRIQKKTTNQAKQSMMMMQCSVGVFFDSVDSVSCKKDIFSLWWARDAIVSSRQQQKNCIGGAAAADCCTFLIAFQIRGDEHFGLIVYLSQQTEPMNCKL